MTFSTITTEGNLIPAEILAEIAAGEAPGQQPTDFGLDKNVRLTDEIAAASDRLVAPHVRDWIHEPGREGLAEVAEPHRQPSVPGADVVARPVDAEMEVRPRTEVRHGGVRIGEYD